MNAEARKIAIITGANNGIGFETTIGIAQAGYHVVMACRSMDKARAAMANVAERVPEAALDIMLLDLSDLNSVRGFADEFRKKHSQLDILINNAGILLYSAKTNKDGIELQFATNHLGHFLLTALLIDLMPDDPASRVISLSSLGHKNAQIHFDDLTCGQDGGVAYGQSKLACLLFGDELNRRLQKAGRKIKSLSAHPGGSDTGLFTDMKDEDRKQLKAQVEQYLHSNESAAQPSLHAALSPDIAGGDYYGPIGPMEMGGDVGQATRDPITDDLDVAERFWTLSEELTGTEFSV